LVSDRTKADAFGTSDVELFHVNLNLQWQSLACVLRSTACFWAYRELAGSCICANGQDSPCVRWMQKFLALSF